MSLIAVFLLSLAVAQLGSSMLGWRAASLTGGRRGAGLLLSSLLFILGATLLPSSAVSSWFMLILILLLPMLTMPLAFSLLLLMGNRLAPPHPEQIFEPKHAAHAGCQAVTIPADDYPLPGLLLHPQRPCGGAVCIVPGAGDTKTSFKWRLVASLLAADLVVLTIDPPGHGAARQHPLRYPNCLATVPAAVDFLHQQPGVKRVGVLGISMGGAMALNALAEREMPVTALVLMATPTRLIFNRRIYYQALWNTYRAPVLSLLQEISVGQLRASWLAGGYCSPHSTAELFQLFAPLQRVQQLDKKLALLLVYSSRDAIAPLSTMGRAMQQAAPHATLLESKKASHVTLTLMPQILTPTVNWLRKQLG